DPSLSPMQLWCNESQERYVLGVPQSRMAEFAALCERERCPFAAVGVATAEAHLTVGYGVLDAGDNEADVAPGPAQHAGRSDHPHGSAVQGTPGPVQHAGRSDHPHGSAVQGTPGPAQHAGRSDHPHGSAVQGTPGPAQHAGRSDHPHGSAVQGTPGPAQHAGRSDHPHGSAVQAGGPHPINLPMDVLFGKAPKMHRDAVRPAPVRWRMLNGNMVDLREAGLRVLAHPTVASKQFLVTIGDRAVGGLTARDQLVGPWQMPVAHCALSLAGYEGLAGEAMAIGERTPLALIDSAAAARMAVGEAITNLCAAPVEALERVKLSANWM